MCPIDEKSSTHAALLGRMQWLKAGVLDVEPPPREWLLVDAEERGFIPIREVGILAGAGGTSKTFGALALAVSIATGKPWLDTYDVASRGASALFLGEEHQDECDRRLYYVAQELKLSEEERRTVESNVMVAPLAGVSAALMATGGQNTDVAHALAEKLESEAPAGGWRLIVFDSLSRFGATDTEMNNSPAAAFIACAEKFTTLPGRPTVAIIHHSNQVSREPGKTLGTSGVRGVTALTDNSRWVLTLTASEESGMVTMRIAKNNYGAAFPQQPELILARRDHGVLAPATEDERATANASKQSAKSTEARDAAEDLEFDILAKVRKHPRHYKSANKLHDAVGGNKQAVLASIKALQASGRLVSTPKGFECATPKLALVDPPAAPAESVPS